VPEFIKVTPAADVDPKPWLRLLLLHGAGAPVQHPFFEELQRALATQGIETWAMNLRYMEAIRSGQKRPPPKMAVLLEELAEVGAQLPDDLPWALAGKSMGGRLVSMLLADADKLATWPLVVAGVVYGYPLCPAAAQKDPVKQTQKLAERTNIWTLLQRPLFILQGTRDAFGDAESVAKLATPMITVEAITGACHDFKVRQRQPADISMMLAQQTREFLQKSVA